MAGIKMARPPQTHLILLLIATVFVAIFGYWAGTAYAETLYTSQVSGYAMGNQHGASGQEVRQTHFANHLSQFCPNAPAASWPYGTRIIMMNPVRLTDGNGYVYSRTNFYLQDKGDPTCSEPNYWADIYHGRYLTQGNLCNCPGSPSPGFCYFKSFSINNCTDAINYGKMLRSYEK